MQLKPGSDLQNGKYRIIKTLGQGGFGITYEAVHTLSNHAIAVKEFFMKDVCNRDMETSRVTVPSVGSQALVEKFRRKFIKEAQMIWGLDHPNIVRVTDVFEENGTAYYVMENLPGGSLADKVRKEGPLSEDLAEKYIRQIADALAYIHSQNTVHLDVKPSNILLNAKGNAVLIDFGISKHYDEAGEQTSSTPVGISKGYAPLEQSIEGDVSQFKPSTDIYALGATLYHLVTGSVPPEASIVYEDGLDRPYGISDRIWHAIEKAMQPRRKDRPQTIGAFLSLLGANPDVTIVDPEPHPKPKPTPKPQPPKPTLEKPKSKTWLWALLGGVAVAAIIIAIVLSGQKSKSAIAEPSVSASMTSTGSINGHEYVDLGLSVKWATCNVGASSPSDYGNYYAWGETTPKSNYSWDTYRYYKSPGSITKYNTNSKDGTVDNKTRLDLSDDAAHQNWGGTWRMPTDAEWTELREKCTWSLTTQGGKNGYKVTSKTNGNSIFLPAAGWRNVGFLNDAGSVGYCWSSSLSSDVSGNAWSVVFNSFEVFRQEDIFYVGFSIRPVSE